MKTILVTGGSGLLGNALSGISLKFPKDKWIFLSRKDGDLKNFDDCKKIFEKHTPTIVIHLAADVGGLFKNMRGNVELFENNLLINFNVVRCCTLYNVQRAICCLSTCIYPDKIPSYPIKEEYLHLGPPHSSNSGYAYAKRFMDIHTQLINGDNNDNGTKFVNIVPTNIYGEFDNFSLEDGHVVPGLIHKAYMAKKNGKPFVVYGTGKPLRQFVYSADVAQIIVNILNDNSITGTINVCPNELNDSIKSNDSNETSIGNLAKVIAQEFGIPENRLHFDDTYSDGQYRKTASNNRLMSIFPNFKFTSIEDGIKKTVQWFEKNYENVRK